MTGFSLSLCLSELLTSIESNSLISLCLPSRWRSSVIPEGLKERCFLSTLIKRISPVRMNWKSWGKEEEDDWNWWLMKKFNAKGGRRSNGGRKTMWLTIVTKKIVSHRYKIFFALVMLHFDGMMLTEYPIKSDWTKWSKTIPRQCFLPTCTKRKTSQLRSDSSFSFPSVDSFFEGDSFNRCYRNVPPKSNCKSVESKWFEWRGENKRIGPTRRICPSNIRSFSAVSIFPLSTFETKLFPPPRCFRRSRRIDPFVGQRNLHEFDRWTNWQILFNWKEIRESERIGRFVSVDFVTGKQFLARRSIDRSNTERNSSWNVPILGGICWIDFLRASPSIGKERNESMTNRCANQSIQSTDRRFPLVCLHFVSRHENSSREMEHFNDNCFRSSEGTPLSSDSFASNVRLTKISSKVGVSSVKISARNSSSYDGCHLIDEEISERDSQRRCHFSSQSSTPFCRRRTSFSLRFSAVLIGWSISDWSETLLVCPFELPHFSLDEMFCSTNVSNNCNGSICPAGIVWSCQRCNCCSTNVSNDDPRRSSLVIIHISRPHRLFPTSTHLEMSIIRTDIEQFSLRKRRKRRDFVDRSSRENFFHFISSLFRFEPVDDVVHWHSRVGENQLKANWGRDSTSITHRRSFTQMHDKAVAKGLIECDDLLFSSLLSRTSHATSRFEEFLHQFSRLKCSQRIRWFPLKISPISSRRENSTERFRRNVIDGVILFSSVQRRRTSIWKGIQVSCLYFSFPGNSSNLFVDEKRKMSHPLTLFALSEENFPREKSSSTSQRILLGQRPTETFHRTSKWINGWKSEKRFDRKGSTFSFRTEMWPTSHGFWNRWETRPSATRAARKRWQRIIFQV